MQPLETSVPQENTVENIVWRIGEDMCRLDPGSLATLRRMVDNPMRAPQYWRWKARYAWPDAYDDRWATIIAAMAVLTQKGRNPAKPSPHDRKNPLGKALCDGGNVGWGAGTIPRPEMSELRLAKLLNTRGPARQAALLRTIRAISRSGKPVNCIDVANFVLFDEDSRPAQIIAKHYYRRLDQAEYESRKTDKED